MWLRDAENRETTVNTKYTQTVPAQLLKSPNNRERRGTNHHVMYTLRELS